MTLVSEIMSCQCKSAVMKLANKMISKEQHEFSNCTCQTQKDGIKTQKYPLIIMRV